MARTTRQLKQDLRSPIGQRISQLRRARGMKLTELAAICSVSEATMSRIETGQTDISAHHLFLLTREMGADIADFFSDDTRPLANGVRAVTRKGEGETHNLTRYVTEVLGSDISNKIMHPAINYVTAESLDEVGGLASHQGEEFLYVLSGSVALHSEIYVPLVLDAGDSIYFEGSMKHAYLKSGDQTATILVVVVSRAPA